MKKRTTAVRPRSDKKKKGSSTLITIILVLIMLVGVGIMAYPTFSDWYNNLHQSRAIADYNQIVSTNDDSRNEELWNEAVQYNEDLAKTGINLMLSQYNAANLDGENEETQDTQDNGTDNGDNTDNSNGSSDADNTGADDTATSDTDAADDSLAAQRQRYYNTLDVSGTGIMGYIDIDKVNIHLPIYHDTSDGVLQVAVGHLAGTSLPVGGTSSHCVLTGHTGLPSAKLFTDIDQLEIGDTFSLVVLDHTLTYEVDDISVVLPYEVSSLQIEEGKDLCTLVTCTPYGINTHRLLVTGHRIETPTTNEAQATPTPRPSEDWQQQQRKITMEQLLPWIALGIAILVILILLIQSLRRRHQKKHPQAPIDMDAASEDTQQDIRDYGSLDQGSQEGQESLESQEDQENQGAQDSLVDKESLESQENQENQEEQESLEGQEAQESMENQEAQENLVSLDGPEDQESLGAQDSQQSKTDAAPDLAGFPTPSPDDGLGPVEDDHHLDFLNLPYPDLKTPEEAREEEAREENNREEEISEETGGRQPGKKRKKGKRTRS